MEKTIMVKVVKCDNKSAWYANKVGELFEVLEQPTEGSGFYILASDEKDPVRRCLNPYNVEVFNDK